MLAGKSLLVRISALPACANFGLVTEALLICNSSINPRIVAVATSLNRHTFPPTQVSTKRTEN